MRPPGRLAALVLVLAIPALAQEKGKPGSAPARPRPNPALTEVFKEMAGATYACTGMIDSPQSPGTQVKTQSEMRVVSEADGFAYSGHYKMEKNAAMPGGIKSTLKWAWDDSRGKLVELGADNAGSTWVGTSEGFKEGTLVWTAEGALMGQPAKVRTTVTRKGSTDVVVVEVENKAAWQKLSEETCRKR